MSRAWASVNCGFFRSAWASWRASGIRPVLTWNSTAAEPTPTRLGPLSFTPWPWGPWQLAQLVSKYPLPCAASGGRVESSAWAAGEKPA
jgi:hypothetical protein